jgi:hypothetical protein
MKPLGALGQINLKLKLITPPRQIEKNILASAVRYLNSRLSGLPSKISKHAKPLLRNALEQSPAAISLISGKLREEMGVVDASKELDQIFRAISQTVNVTISRARRRGSGVRMTIRLTAVPFDFDTVVGDNGSYTTEKGAIIPWFKWLTAAGDRIIVRDYDVEGGHPMFSRTGDMIMIKAGKRGWRVPPEFAGTPTVNFVTKATDSILPDLGHYIQSTARKML